MPSDGFDQPALESLSDAPGVGDAEAALQVEVECAERVNFAMQQNGVPLVERVSITNTGAAAAERVSVSIALENGECEPWSGRQCLSFIAERIASCVSRTLIPNSFAP